MCNIDHEILELVQRMTPEQRLKALEIARAVLGMTLERHVSAQETSPEYTP